MSSEDKKEDKKHHDLWPVPLRTRKGDLGRAVRVYEQSTAETSREEVNYAKVTARLDGSSRRVQRYALGGSVLVLAVAAVAIVARTQHVPVPPRAIVAEVPPSTSTGSRRPVASLEDPVAAPVRPAPARPLRAEPSRVVPSIQLGERPLSLPTGEIDIVEQARAVLFADAEASATSRRGAAEIALERGRIELHVLPRTPGHPLSVHAGRYRFTVIGTVFTVSRSLSRVELVVREGAVAVSRGKRQLAMVAAGNSWSSDLATPSAALPSPAFVAETPSAPLDPVHEPLAAPESPPPSPGVLEPPPTAPRAETPTDPDCRQLVARRQTQEAVACYQKQAMRSGLAGETAAYDLARLLRDTLGKPERALTAFESLRARFPQGVLRREAALSIIELLPRVGRHAEALAESQHFLATYANDERKGEVHLLRGNIYREVFKDLNRAASEYAQGTGARGRVGDDSRFLHAVCLEALGRMVEARRAYQTYLHQHGGAHVAEAEKRLESLGP